MSDTIHAMPAPPTKLFAALVEAQKACSAVAKSGTNAFHRYRYATAEDIIEEARGALNANGLAVVTSSWDMLPDTLTSATPSLGVNYWLVHNSGESMLFATVVPMVPDKGRPLDKAQATALTYGLAYFLRGLLLLPRSDEGKEKGHQPDERNDTSYTPPAPPDHGAASASFTLRIAEATTVDALRAIVKEIGAAKLPPAMHKGLIEAAKARKAALEMREPGAEG